MPLRLIKGKSDDEKLREDFEMEVLPLTADLFRIAMFLTRNRDEAEDLVQETLMQGLKSFHRYTLGTNARAWLTKIMYNTFYKQLRKKTNLKLVPDPDDIIAQTLAYEPPVSEKVTDEEVLLAIDKVPETYREIVVLSDVEGFSYKEIAAILEIPIGTVMSRLHRGRGVLRKELAEIANEFGIDTEKKGKGNKEGGKSK